MMKKIVATILLLFSQSTWAFLPTKLHNSFSKIKENGGENGLQSSIIFREYQYSNNNYISTFTSDGKVVMNEYTNKNNYINAFLRMKEFLSSVFLPLNSMPDDYLKYQRLNLLQDLCSYLRNIMTTKQILEGLGVGRADVTAATAAVQWIIRDGASMLGGFIFTFISSAQFGQNIKSWRFFADIINNVGITIEMIAPIFRKQFLALICFASICKTLCGVSAGATNAAINEHFSSRSNNIAEVLAKNSAQHTMISLIGLLMSVKFTHFSNKSPQRIWIIYTALTIIHVITNYKLMKTLVLKSLNLIRFQMVSKYLLNSKPIVDAFLNNSLSYDSTFDKNHILQQKENLQNNMDIWMTKESASTKQISPDHIASCEPIFSLLLPTNFRNLISNFLSIFSKNREDKETAILMFYSPSKLQKSFSTSEIEESFHFAQHTKSPYLLLLKQNEKKREVAVVFQQNVQPLEQVRAFLDALMFAKYPDSSKSHVGRSIFVREILMPVVMDTLSKAGWDCTQRGIMLQPPNAKVFSAEVTLHESLVSYDPK